MIKKIILGINILLFLAVLYLLYVHFFGTKPTTSTQTTGQNGNVAYVNMDILLKEYKYAVALSDELASRQEDIRTDLNIEGKKLEKMVKSFQRKLQNNGFTSRKRAERAQKRILDKEKKLQELKDKLTQELYEKQDKMLKNLGDTLDTFFEMYNTTKDFDLILRTSKNGNVLFGKETLDITGEVIEFLNERYKEEE